MAIKLSKPVYQLYKKHSILTAKQHWVNTPFINSTIGYHIREGIHNFTEYDLG